MSARLLVLDVDGVMTDGSIIYDDEGRELKAFHVRDGFALRLWARMGMASAIITGRSSPVVERRARELGITRVVQGSADKATDLARVLGELGVAPRDAAFLGDDWPDMTAMRLVGRPMAVADAHPDVRALASYITPSPGGRGAVRDAVEHLLDRGGLLARARAFYDEPNASEAHA